MKFGKTYAALIYDPAFPEEWRDKAINYRQARRDRIPPLPGPSSQSRAGASLIADPNESDEPRAVYELSHSPQTHTIAPLIRLRLPHRELHANSEADASGSESDSSSASSEGGADHDALDGDSVLDPSVMLSSLQLQDPASVRRVSSRPSSASTESEQSDGQSTPPSSPRNFQLETLRNFAVDVDEVVIPLNSDSAFLQLLSNALNALATLYRTIVEHCETEVGTLSTLISSSARPRSEKGKSDLDTWRAIFQLWVESEIFESLSEQKHGELDVQESERRLTRFMDEVTAQHLDDRRAFKITSSREALKRFFSLNLLILDLKKFQLANAEATRKILKKHEKRTSLPSSVVVPSLSLTVRGSESLPHVMLCMITNTLLPVIPSIDGNLDSALMSLMEDWFPRETRIKVKEDSAEAAKEMAEEMNLDSDCRIM
ncbi:hypothetical protein FRB99_006330 [Tulasnella sp. 403]|nr:hypothetical protein FRB99_006330 [Tulasnella sp. 403]